MWMSEKTKKMWDNEIEIIRGNMYYAPSLEHRTITLDVFVDLKTFQLLY